MYENIGKKIKGLAKATFVVAAIAAVVTGISLMASDEDLMLYGLLVMVVGPIVAWVSSWLLYGFGQLIENSDIIAGRQKVSIVKQEKIIDQNNEHTHVQRCAEDYAFVDTSCPKCKATLSYPKWQLQSEEGVTCPMCHTHISM